MITKHQNYLNMARAVKLVLNRHEAVWDKSVAFTQTAKKLDDLLQNTFTTEAGATTTTVGVTEDKYQAGNEAIQLGVNLAKRASVYALDTNNMDLHRHLRISRSSLASVHDGDAAATLRDVYKKMMAVLKNLQDYDVTEMDLKALNSKLAIFENLVAAPRDRISERKNLNDNIPKLISRLRSCFYRMDSLINKYEDTPFEGEYRIARKVIDLGSRKDKPEEEQ